MTAEKAKIIDRLIDEGFVQETPVANCLHVLEELLSSQSKELSECKEFADSRIKLTSDLNKHLAEAHQELDQLREENRKLKEEVKDSGSIADRAVHDYSLLNERTGKIEDSVKKLIDKYTTDSANSSVWPSTIRRELTETQCKRGWFWRRFVDWY